jgi:hypothetical protein
MTKRRVVTLEKDRKYSPWKAKLWIDGRLVSLGRYKSREAAETACKAVRKVCPAKRTTKPPLTDEKRTAILASYERLQNGRATAREHGVSHETVQRIVRETPKAAALGRDPREPIGDCW